jgi:hypothetical protein
VWDAGDRGLGLVWGTYGLEGATPLEARTSLGSEQAFGLLRGERVALVPDLFAGLPTNARGYVTADLELGGSFPAAAWLSRVDTRLAQVSRGALFERSRSYLVWEEGRWTESPTGSDVVLSGLRTPPFLEGTLCTTYGPGVRFARYATERFASGEVLLAGRCEDELQRSKSGLFVARLPTGSDAWQIAEAPPSPMFDAIVNVDLVHATRTEAFLYAYTPYDETPREAYVLRFAGERWSREALPFQGPVVAMAQSAEGATWAVARFREVYMRPPGGRWTPVTLPPARFADRAPPDLRVLEVQAAGGDTFVHAAYPMVVRAPGREPRPGRSHILYTTRAWKEPLFCDAERPASAAVGGSTRVLEAARGVRAARTFETSP